MPDPKITLIIENIRAKKTPIFSTEKSVDAIIEKLQLKGEAVVGLMITVNTVLELIAQEIENGNRSE
jgi:hypothetical protein